MRIRKNPNGIPVEGTSLPKHSSFLVCELNRSPWDDELLFSQFIEKWDASLNVNGTLADPIHVSDSEETEEDAMEVSSDYVESENPKTPPKLDDDEEMEEEEQRIEVVPDVKMDVQQRSRGRRVGRPPKKLAPSPSSPPPPPPPSPRVHAPKKRGRPKKSLTSTTVVASGESSDRGRPCRTLKNKKSNPHEFYYYSGFGPSWGKKRGDVIKSSNNTAPSSSSVATIDNSDGGRSNNDNEGSTKDHVDVMSEEGEDYAKGKNNNNNNSDARKVTKKRNKKKVVGIVEVVYDYGDDEFDDDDDDDEVLQAGKRIRPRKPIKARSLQSLM